MTLETKERISPIIGQVTDDKNELADDKTYWQTTKMNLQTTRRIGRRQK